MNEFLRVVPDPCDARARSNGSDVPILESFDPCALLPRFLNPAVNPIDRRNDQTEENDQTMSASLLRRGHVIDNGLTVTEHWIDILLVCPESSGSDRCEQRTRSNTDEGYSFSSPNQVCGVD